MKKTIISEKITNVLSNNHNAIQDKKKLDRQQNYYKNLSKKGVAKKNTYNLKPLSMI